MKNQSTDKNGMTRSERKTKEYQNGFQARMNGVSKANAHFMENHI
jgi:hypothetical protein